MPRPLKSECIEKFLAAKARPDLAKLYSPAMEVQVNVAKDNGERLDKEYNGRKYTVWTDGEQEWKNFRLPQSANTDPVDNDYPITFDLAARVEGIGLTGWDWRFRKSRWVAFDFDAIIGHSEAHEAKLTDSELNAVRDAAYAIPWVTVRKSTSGNGLHLYVFVSEVETQNHTEHAALARAILGKMSALTGFDFDGKVDNCFSGDTEILTDRGIRTLKEVAGTTVKVWQLTPDGYRWVDAEIKSFGMQKTYPVHFDNNSTVRATMNHLWLFSDSRGRVDLVRRKYTSELTYGTRVPLAKQALPEVDWGGSETTSVVAVGDDACTEEVFCAVAPAYHNFTLANGVVTANCGHVHWIWHRKFEKVGGITGTGLKLIKEGEVLYDIPLSWRDHIRVSSGKRRKTIPSIINEKQVEWFEEMCGQHPKIALDDQHKALLKWLDENARGAWWWDADHWMCVCHTADLKAAHNSLGLRGLFETSAKGADIGDQNAYMFPMRDGAWVVRRHTPGVQESRLWDKDTAGWTRCYLNRQPDLRIAARAFGGAESENGAFEFPEAEIALFAASALGTHINLERQYLSRRAWLKPHRDGRLIFEIAKEASDKAAQWEGWVDKKTKWHQVLNSTLPTKYEQEIGNYDEVVRHLVSSTGGDAGWSVKADERWEEEPITHVKLGLMSMGNTGKEANLIMGQAVLKRWTLVNEPFLPEYPGDRRWNRDAAQLACTPNPDVDNLHHPTWDRLLMHVGRNLTEGMRTNQWCKDNSLVHGGEYLKLWIASLFQKPFDPLPYLFFYSTEQGTGKTTFHEAISLLMTRGVVRADAALVSQSGFNGELMSAVACVIEETDLRQNRSQAYNRIKDWTTGRTLNIHMKGGTPFSAPNTTHWIQCANDAESCPIFPNDTRITMIRVDPIPAEQYIAKRDLIEMLRKEAPDFLTSVMNTEIPLANDRLNIPVIMTQEKERAAKLNQTELDAFLEENCHFVSGKMISISEFYDRFREWLDPERRPFWTKIKITRNLPRPIVKGRSMKDGAKHMYGNISWEPRMPGEPESAPLTLDGEKLV